MSIISLETLAKQLHSGELHPVYLLYGPEEFTRREALRRIKAAALDEETLAFNLSEFHGKSDSTGRIMEAVDTMPLLAPVRVVVVDEAQSITPEEQKSWTAYLSRPNKKCVLVLVAADLDRRTAFYKALKDKGCVVECLKLKGPGLQRWAEGFLHGRGYSMSSKTLKRLLDMVGSDLDTLAGELTKLMLYCDSKKNITDREVDQVVRRGRLQSIFELTDALGRRDRQAALMSMDNLLNAGEPPLRILTMMARHFRQVLIAQAMLAKGCRANEIGSAAQIPPFLLNEFLRQSRSLESGLLRELFLRVGEADLRLKSSGVSPRLILESIVHAI